MEHMKIVKENPNLVRDPSSGAILNTSKSAYENAVRAAKAAQAERERMDAAINDINNVKSELSEVKELLKELLQKV